MRNKKKLFSIVLTVLLLAVLLVVPAYASEDEYVLFDPFLYNMQPPEMGGSSIIFRNLVAPAFPNTSTTEPARSNVRHVGVIVTSNLQATNLGARIITGTNANPGRTTGWLGHSNTMRTRVHDVNAIGANLRVQFQNNATNSQVVNGSWAP